jgi:hypothetical protein
MTREQKLRYAQKTGGMVGRMMTAITGNLFTLDKALWTGNTYSFIYHINERVSSIYYKQIITLPVLAAITLEASKDYDFKDLPPVFHMISKLENLTKGN